jgi:succinylglutamic semialdehyde dehydrogenase
VSETGANLIAGTWREIPGKGLRSWNPARPSECVWSGSPAPAHVDEALAGARRAFREWSRVPLERRAAVLRRFAALAREREDELTTVIREEVGKVHWDARDEARALANKVEITLDPAGPLRRVTGFEVDAGSGRAGRCWFRPHGIMVVLGPFNFPVHLPNGHIVPALLMGNTVVFKPSEKAPRCGQMLARLYHDALIAEGAPPAAVSLVHGAGDVASALVSHEEPDGVLFTGSWVVGRAIMAANLDRPGRILALEMGGNNAAVVMPDADLRMALAECVRSAYISAGQRCTCTRRVIVHRQVASRFVPALCRSAAALIIGDPAAAHPVFLGPVITDAARERVLEAQRRLARRGAEVLVPCQGVDGGTGGWYLTPGVVRVERFEKPGEPDCEEVFGPLVQVSTCDSLDDAIQQANATAFGLAASIFTRDAANIERFRSEARAGCVNVNVGTAGASSRLPFGGLGLSGNHRPAGAFSLDYCAYPVAGMSRDSGEVSLPPGMMIDPKWL